MQNTYQEKILDLETTNNSPRVKLEGGIKFKIKSDFKVYDTNRKKLEKVFPNFSVANVPKLKSTHLDEENQFKNLIKPNINIVSNGHYLLENNNNDITATGPNPEEIFGEIEDEYDNEALTEQLIGEREFLLSARLEIDYLNEKYAWNLPEGDFETLSGFILSQTENLPNIGETITYGRFTFTIVSKQAHRIETVRLKINDSVIF